jgi:hypothetical protein
MTTMRYTSEPPTEAGELTVPCFPVSPCDEAFIAFMHEQERLVCAQFAGPIPRPEE